MSKSTSVSRPTMNERFWAKVDKTGECWEWTAGVASTGYGAFWDGKQMSKAHRFSYEIANGPLARNLHVDHMCHNRRCVNPAHLRAVTQKQNIENHSGSAHKDSKSGVRGVVWVKDCHKWGVYVSSNGKSMYFGVYESIAEAEQVAKAARNRLHTHNDMDRATV